MNGPGGNMDKPKLCPDCDKRLHQFMAGQPVSPYLCEKCSADLEKRRAEFNKAMAEKQNPD